MIKNVRRKCFLLIAIAAILIATIIWTIWGNMALELNRITIVSIRIPEAFAGYRIAQVSDLHNAEFGDENKKLLDILKKTEPDIIAITGDMIDSDHTNIDIAIDFAEVAVSIAPCYFVTGNHESWSGCYEKLEEGLIRAGVFILRDTSVNIERNGEMITLLGIDDPAFASDEDIYDEMSATTQDKISKLMDNIPGYSILLSHRPELFDAYSESGVDLVLSGHAHGGQVRLPFIGGLVAPNQGFFPKYDAGLYADENINMVVSRGLGNSIIPLRFNNRPEVVLVELQKE